MKRCLLTWNAVSIYLGGHHVEHEFGEEMKVAKDHTVKTCRLCGAGLEMLYTSIFELPMKRAVVRLWTHPDDL